VGATSPRERPTDLTPSAIARRTSPAGRRAACMSAGLVAPWPRKRVVEVLRVARGVVYPPHPCRPAPQSAPLASPEAGAPSTAARRSGDRTLARRFTAAIPSRSSARTARRGQTGTAPAAYPPRLLSRCETLRLYALVSRTKFGLTKLSDFGLSCYLGCCDLPCRGQPATLGPSQRR